MADADVVIYYNALCRSAKRYANRYAMYFGEQQQTVTVIASSASRHHDIERLQRHCAQAAECLVIGGDGSVNIAANVLAHSTTALTVIPLGTGNDFARSQHLHHWRWRLQQPVRHQRQSLGCIMPNRIYFVNHVGVGLSVDLMRLQPRWFKHIAGKLSYTFALLRYLLGHERHRSRIRHKTHWDDGQIIALGRCIGGGIPVHPRADRVQGTLAYIGIPKLPRITQYRALWRVLRGKITDVTELEYYEGTEFTLGDAEHIFEIDGDTYFHGPVTVKSVTEALVVSLPANTTQQVNKED